MVFYVKKQGSALPVFDNAEPVFCLIFFVIEDNDTCAYQNKGDEQVDERNISVFLKHDIGENNAENGSHKAEHSYLGNGVVLQQYSPESIGDSGEECQIDENAQSRHIVDTDISAEQQTDNYHNRAAEDKLIAAEDNRVLIFGIALHQNRGSGIRNSGEQHEAVAVEIHIEVKSVEINNDDSRKTKDAGNYLFEGEALLLKDKAGDEDSEENVSAADNSSLNAGGVGKTDIEEKVLYHGLEAAYLSDKMQILLLGEEELLSADAVKQNGEYSRQSESYSREKYSGGNTLMRQDKLITQLDKGGGAAPKRAAYQRRDGYEPRICVEFFVCVFHVASPKKCIFISP